MPNQEFPIEVFYVQGVTVKNYNPSELYNLVQANSTEIEIDPSVEGTKVGVNLLGLFIHDAPERRQLLGLKPDHKYEVLINIIPKVFNAKTEEHDVVKFGQLYEVNQDASIGGFRTKPIFKNLPLKESLSFEVELVEIDNAKVDSDPLEVLMSEAGLGQALDLLLLKSHQKYIKLASNVVNAVQNAFGRDLNGDDVMWRREAFELVIDPTIAGSYRFQKGIYVLIANPPQHITDYAFQNGKVMNRENLNRHIEANYLILGIG